jgi:GGDEF domain-containing protein
MERGVPRRRRPRPVVSAGVEALLLRSEELAKGWLLALLEDAPLEEAAAIMAGEVARDGPRICDAVVRAIYDEADLRRIEQGGVLEPLASRAGEIAGARTAEAAAHAVETLKDVVWSALRSELLQADPEILGDAAERLSLVAELVRAAVLRRRGVDANGGNQPARVSPLRVARTETPAPTPEGQLGAGAAHRRAEGGSAPGHEGAAGPAGGAAGPAGGAAGPAGGAAGAAGPGGVGAGAVGGTAGAAAGARFGQGGRTDGEDEDQAEASRFREVAPADGSEEGALWIGALRDEIVRAARARMPLSLLLVELDEAERMWAAEPHARASATFGRFAQAVRSSVRRRDVLACETDTRAWIIARDTGRAGAQALGSRIVAAVPAEESWRGAPLSVSVGLAVLGEDGQNAAALIDVAEQTRFAAEASGIGIVTAGSGEAGGSEPPPAGGPGLAG